ncbi:unnamed protein product [Vitrella brassicaformis CCMP3155]|uniref:Protein kinase domain-containing protein n=1 Tax=Vitrella brassicaformis (strain CCMP3155) TaxID=1169540 RepID=A0A0G4EIT8_VITBC|nr:unnamed protein product [Vitrella brassicaformis CCMP3155]|eukprot:CEL96930.1 unnamed protein product [Vitrella brassicaformis CCMP3155]
MTGMGRSVGGPVGAQHSRPSSRSSLPSRTPAMAGVPRLVIYARDLTFSEDDKLGRGGFGVVYRGVFKGRPVAVKVAHPSEELAPHEQFIEVLREVEPMFHLRHPNIVEFLGVCAADEKHGLMIVTELCECGSLDKYLAKNRPLPPDVRDRFVREICEGVQYLHDHGIAHLDLKPGNILLAKYLVIKISDFGMTRNTQRTTSSFAGGGTYNFMSPETMNPEKLVKPSTKSDIWTLGGILSELHGGQRIHKSTCQTHYEMVADRDA